MESYFGRVANVFRMVRTKVPSGCDMVNPFLKALCFLANVHVFKSPLRKEEFKLHRALVACRHKKHAERKKASNNNREGGEGLPRTQEHVTHTSSIPLRTNFDVLWHTPDTVCM